MPASAGRVRMPHNNRMSGSSALNTSAIWKDVIKYDPYAGNEEAAPAMDEATSLQQQGFLDVVKKQVSAMNLEQKRGACRKCGNVGHLTYQCRNFVDQSLNEKASDASSSDSSDDEAPAMPAGDLKPTADGKRSASSDDDSEPKRGRKRDRSRSRDREERSRSRSGERKKSKKHKKSKDKKKKEKKHKKEKKSKKEKRR